MTTLSEEFLQYSIAVDANLKACQDFVKREEESHNHSLKVQIQMMKLRTNTYTSRLAVLVVLLTLMAVLLKEFTTIALNMPPESRQDS